MTNIYVPQRFLNRLTFYSANNANIEKVILYGSRARGNFQVNSDIDLAFHTAPISHTEQNLIENAIQEIPTHLKIDIVFIDRLVKKELVQNIKEDGVILYEKGKALREA